MQLAIESKSKTVQNILSCIPERAREYTAFIDVAPFMKTLAEQKLLVKFPDNTSDDEREMMLCFNRAGKEEKVYIGSNGHTLYIPPRWDAELDDEGKESWCTGKMHIGVKDDWGFIFRIRIQLKFDRPVSSGNIRTCIKIPKESSLHDLKKVMKITTYGDKPGEPRDTVFVTYEFGMPLFPTTGRHNRHHPINIDIFADGFTREDVERQGIQVTWYSDTIMMGTLHYILSEIPVIWKWNRSYYLSYDGITKKVETMTLTNEEAALLSGVLRVTM